MGEPTQIKWRIVGEEFSSCRKKRGAALRANCASRWGFPMYDDLVLTKLLWQDRAIVIGFSW